jgi:hypothetical protein
MPSIHALPSERQVVALRVIHRQPPAFQRSLAVRARLTVWSQGPPEVLKRRRHVAIPPERILMIPMPPHALSEAPAEHLQPPSGGDEPLRQRSPAADDTRRTARHRRLSRSPHIRCTPANESVPASIPVPGLTSPAVPGLTSPAPLHLIHRCPRFGNRAAPSNAPGVRQPGSTREFNVHLRCTRYLRPSGLRRRCHQAQRAHPGQARRTHLSVLGPAAALRVFLADQNDHEKVCCRHYRSRG